MLLRILASPMGIAFGDRFVRLARAGAFDDVEQAAATWRTVIGAAARDATLQPVDGGEALPGLPYWYRHASDVMGDEPRPVMDNWFRARRRYTDLLAVMDQRGTPLIPNP